MPDTAALLAIHAAFDDASSSLCGADARVVTSGVKALLARRVIEFTKGSGADAQQLKAAAIARFKRTCANRSRRADIKR